MDWTTPKEIEETQGAERIDVDLSHGGEGSHRSR